MLVGLGGTAQAGPAQAWPKPVPVVTKVETEDPVVFITIDDGWFEEEDLPALIEARQLLLDRRVPASLFLLPGAYAQRTDYFRTFLDHGPSRIENHTLNHPDLTTLDGASQRAEICGARDRQLAAFGDGPRLLRPSGGADYQWPYYNDETLTAARACGAEALVTWTHGDLTSWGSWTPPMPELRAGDILLLHFTKNLKADLTRVLDAVDEAGLTPANLRQYVLDGGRG